MYIKIWNGQDPYEKSKVDVENIISLIKQNNNKIEDISTDDGDLEDVFLRLTKN